MYSHYYANGVVDFFFKHHSRENVLFDIENGIVWILQIVSSEMVRLFYATFVTGIFVTPHVMRLEYWLGIMIINVEFTFIILSY